MVWHFNYILLTYCFFFPFFLLFFFQCGIHFFLPLSNKKNDQSQEWIFNTIDCNQISDEEVSDTMLEHAGDQVFEIINYSCLVTHSDEVSEKQSTYNAYTVTDSLLQETQLVNVTSEVLDKESYIQLLTTNKEAFQDIKRVSIKKENG